MRKELEEKIRTSSKNLDRSQLTKNAKRNQRKSTAAVGLLVACILAFPAWGFGLLTGKAVLSLTPVAMLAWLMNYAYVIASETLARMAEERT